MDRLYERENVEVEMCRLCFTLALSQQAITNSPYAQEFNNFKFIELQIGFELPANICGQCLVQLNQLGSYLKMCKDAYNTYKLMKPSPQKPPPNPELTSDIKQEAVESESEEIFETSIDIADESEKLFAKFSEEDPFFETITQPQIAKVEIDCDDTSSDPFYCEDTNMEEMMNKETSSQTRTCPTCGVNVTTLASHYSKNPKCGPRNSHCPTCNLYFGNKHRLLHHQKTHHPEEVSTTSLMCHICLKAFQYADSLSQHLQTHENDQQDGCDQSGNVMELESPEILPAAVLGSANNEWSSLLPAKSRFLYERTYNEFQAWCTEQNITNYTESVLLAYFANIAKRGLTASLWPKFSMLKATLNIQRDVDIGQFNKVIKFIKRQTEGYVARKTKVLEKEQVQQFILDAPDNLFLMTKVALIFGIAGALRKQELLQLETCDVVDLQSKFLVTVPASKTKTKEKRTFAILDNDKNTFLKLIRQYMSLRPLHTRHTRFFIYYKDNRCSTQPVGVNTFAKLPCQVAKFLKLEQPHLYTGNCFHRSSASILSDSGADFPTIKRHGGWK